jgi:tetratricopeptide (TPR) repeat protein
MKARLFLAQIGVILAASITLASTPSGDSDARFAQANQEFSDGKFKEAISDYEAIVHAGDWSAALFYDLGNSYFRVRDFGRAILNYERALALEPNHPEAQANLRMARDEARALELMPSWPDRFVHFASLNQYTIGAAVSFWMGAFLLAAAFFSQRRRGPLVALFVTSWIATALLLFVTISIERGSKGRSLAVVIDNEIQARLATADTASSVLALPAGSEIKVEQQRGDWIYAALPNNLRGWISAKSVQLVRL